jgi:hypothetical protein
MDQQALAARARELKIELDEATPESLLSEIKRELRGLQSAELTLAQKRRRTKLTAALVEIQTTGEMETSLSTIPVKTLVRLLDGVESRIPVADARQPEREMKKVATVAATQARRDFRASRTLPFAGFGAIVVTLWGLREAFGVDLTWVGTLAFGVAATSAVVVAFVIYLLLGATQRRDEGILKRLFTTRVQTAALRDVLERKQSIERQHRTGHVGEVDFDHDYFLARLWVAASGRDDLDDALYYARSRRQQQSAYRRYEGGPSGHFLSTVDLAAAAEEAADLALDRFVALGTVVAVPSLGGDRFAVPAEVAERELGAYLDPT